MHRLLEFDRFEVITNWPGSKCNIGDIIQVPHGELYSFDGKEKYSLFSMPLLFRKMHWAERRAPEEMPKVVELKGVPSRGSYYIIGDILTVEEWQLTTAEERRTGARSSFWVAHVKGGHKYDAIYVEPSDKSPKLIR